MIGSQRAASREQLRGRGELLTYCSHTDHILITGGKVVLRLHVYTYQSRWTVMTEIEYFHFHFYYKMLPVIAPVFQKQNWYYMCKMFVFFQKE